jgi:MYXO-CTERM domain-containing protein
VRFPAAAEATAAGTLTVTFDNNQTRTAQISARALATSMALTPDGDVDLGPVCIGQSKSQTFTVLANADGGFAVSSITSPDAPFTLTAPTLPAGVKGAGADMLAFDVRVAPTAGGSVLSTMTVTTDIPGSTPREIHLAAIGLAAGVSGTPDLLDLGSEPVDTTTIGQEITISNCATTPTNLANARIEGVDATSFAIVQQPSSMTLAPNGVAKWLVVLTPRSVGQKTATFSVDHDDGTATVLLAGEGLGDSVFGDNGPKGYYACSTTNATAWPLLFVLGAFLVSRRRRRR